MPLTFPVPQFLFCETSLIIVFTSQRILGNEVGDKCNVLSMVLLTWQSSTIFFSLELFSSAIVQVL